MENRQAQERGEGDRDAIEEHPVDSDPIPTRAEARRAALTLSRYTLDKDDPFLRELDSSLVKFRRKEQALEMCGMKETKITSYFVRQ